MKTNTIHSIDANGQERIDTVQAERVGEVIRRLQHKGQLRVRVIS